MNTDISMLGTILSVWAHPDDETYLAAGIMSRAVALGQRVLCVTATRGEKGSWDEERWPSDTMGRVREGELMRSLEILGIPEHRWLDYIDAECETVPFEEGVGRIVELFDEVQPDSILTFGPEGMTGHADHKAISRWTTEAFARAAKPGAALYHATQSAAWAEKFVPILNRFDVFEEGTPPITAEDDLAIDFRLDDEMRARKLKAILAHDSQVDGMKSVFGEEMFYESSTERELFRLAARA